MDIIVGDIGSHIKDQQKCIAALAIVRDVCRARPNGYKFMPKYRSGHWDGYISLMLSFSMFPTGLLSIVVSALESRGYHVNVDRAPLCEHSIVVPEFLNDIVLRDYQIDAANKLLDAGRGIARMATNSGKTEVMAAIIKALNQKSLIVLHRKELMYQTADRLSKRLGTEIGMIGDGIWEYKFITVAMIQTLSNAKDLSMFHDTSVVIIDECHHTGSDQMMNVLGKIPGRYRFGFSGTPLKGDVLADMKLISATGDVVCDVTNMELIEGGYSAKPVIKMCIIERDGDDDWELIYRKAYTSLIVENEDRNNKIVEFAKESTGTVLILVSRLDHGRKLRDMIPGSVFIHGSDSSEYRMEMLLHMRDHSGVFIASPIFDEGIDVPRVDTVILACGGKSYVKLLQRIGRGMRKKDDGKNELIIIDFIDDTNKYLLKHSDRRIKTYVSEGFDAKVVDAKPGIVLHKST